MGDEVKRRRGRPIEGEESRTRQFLVRVSPAEHAAIESAAASAGLTGPGWIRDRALEALGGETSVDLDVAELAELRRRVQELEAWRARVRGKVDDLADLDEQLERALAAAKTRTS